MRTAIYAGTFDPVTLGHLDILDRASQIFDKVVMAVAENPEKDPMFSQQERIDLLQPHVDERPTVELVGFNSLLVELAEEHGAVALIRGLRAISDFEYEFQMAHMNRHLDDQLETIFLMPTENFFYTSSSLIKGVARYRGDIQELVPDNVFRALREKCAPLSGKYLGRE